MMEDLPVYFDEAQGVYRLFEVDEDSGVEELPFTSFIKIEEDVCTQTVSGSHTSNLFTDSNCELEEDDLAYVDDERDADYKPNIHNCVQKKDKCKFSRRYQHRLPEHHELIMMTPEKQTGMISSDGESITSSLRHYARKDRTPKTILKMMERHRESERVRHHTLNESMKDVCLRVPGYDPDVKETKVIQMQRIIGYECFLENTLNSLCTQLGLPTKVLKLGTNFITDAMKDTPIEDFYQPSNYKTSDIDDDDDDDDEDDDLVPLNRSIKMPTRCKVTNSSSLDKNVIRYRRDKLSSVTIDSASDGRIKIYSLAQGPHPAWNHTNEHYDHDGWLPARGFVPLESLHSQLSSQESGIKMETQSSLDEDQSFHDIDSLIEHGLCHDPEHLKTVTASFMKEEPVSSTTALEEGDAFNLSSPTRDSEHSFIFLRSPQAKGIWHPAISAHSDACDTLNSREMQTVSPENVLETKPNLALTSDQSPHNFTFSVSPTQEVVTIKSEPEDDWVVPDMATGQNQFSFDANNYCTATEYRQTKLPNQVCSSTVSHNNATSSQSGAPRKLQPPTEGLHLVGSSKGKNKRKRYTPFRSPLTDICNHFGEGVDEHLMSKLRKSEKLDPIRDPGRSENFYTRSGLERKASGKKSTSAKHRENPGVHNSHIQKMLGQMWRNMSPEDQEPYREKAKQCSNYLKRVHDSLFTEFTESIVDTSKNGRVTSNC